MVEPKTGRDLVLDQLRAYLYSATEADHLVSRMTHYHLESGGKCIRGMMALDEALHLGLSVERVLPWAAACELLHNATLVHDDIQDHDPLRRARESVWKKFGVAQAINVGDSLLFQCYRCLTAPEVRDCCSQLVRCLSNCAEQLVIGQAEELELTQHPKGDLWEAYLKIAQQKTGSLIQTTIQGVHLLAGRSLKESAIETAPWALIGLVYQINDDINDFLGNKQKEQRQKDFEERRMNSLVAYLAKYPEYHDIVERYTTHAPGSEAHLACIPDLCHAIEQAGICEELGALAESYFSEFDEKVSSPAKERIVAFVSSCYRPTMVSGSL